MGWLSNFFDKLGHLFAYLLGLGARLLKLIADALTWLRIKLSIEIAEWLEDDSNWVIAIAVLIVGAAIMPSLLAKIAAFTQKISTALLLKYAYDQLESMERIRQLIQLQAMHDIAKILWPDYREACDEFNAALSGLATELKLGAGYIHAYLAMCRGVLSGTIAIFGLPPESLEYDWFALATDWTGKLEDRLWRYIEHPEQIYSDIIEEIFLPLQQEYTATQQLELDQIYERIRRIEEIRDGISEIEQSLSTFISEMPDEIERILLEKVGPGLEDIRESIELFDVEFSDRLDAIMNVLQAAEDKFEAMNRRIDEIKIDPIDLTAQHALMSDREKSLFAVWLTEAVEPAVQEAVVEAKETVLPILEESDEIINEALSRIKPIESASYEQVGMFAPAGPGRVGGESWFVGEF
jgi:hypothetical protein